MAIPGIIENQTGWQAVADPTYTPQTQPWHHRLLGKPPQRMQPPSVKATDFIDKAVADHAGRFVAAVKAILGSDTVASGGLGNPDTIRSSLISHLYKRLLAMRTVDDSLVELETAKATAIPGSDDVIDKMSAVIADSLQKSVIHPTEDVETLANQVRLRDMRHRLPQMANELEDGTVESLDTVAAHIQALCDLDTTVNL